MKRHRSLKGTDRLGHCRRPLYPALVRRRWRLGVGLALLATLCVAFVAVSKPQGLEEVEAKWPKQFKPHDESERFSLPLVCSPGGCVLLENTALSRGLHTAKMIVDQGI